MNYKTIFINGEWIPSKSNETIEVENPADKSIIGSVPACNEEDVKCAVEAARVAFESWQFSKLEDRISLLEKLSDELYKRVDEMADTIMKELGAPRNFARNTQVIPYLEEMKNFISVAREYSFTEEYDGFKVVKEPVGVVGAITPWNYPLGQIMKKLSPTILSGSTMVLKPSQHTPLVSYILAEAIEDAGFPKGVFNLVPGRGADVGDPLATHPDVDLLTFTGSTKGGREVSKLALDDIKRITLELGGKSPAVILKGTDLNLALRKVLPKIYMNTGQSCSALSRLIVPEGEKEEIEEIIKDLTRRYKFGDPKDPKTTIGPLSSKSQFDKVKCFIEKGIEEGARLVLGEVPKESGGYFVGPVVFSDVDNNMEIARNEIFGPVLSIISYKTVEEAVKIANDTEYGLSSAVFGPEKEALEVARKIKAGNVVVNGADTTSKAPFGGYKHSGVGREGGKYGLEEFLEVKAIFI